MADDNYRTRGLSASTKRAYDLLKKKSPESWADEGAMQSLMDLASGKNVGSVDPPGPDGFGTPFNPMESTYKREAEIGIIQASRLMLEDLSGAAPAPPASTKIGAPGPMDKGFVGPHGPVPGSGGGKKLGKPGPLEKGYDGPSPTASGKKLGMPGPMDKDFVGSHGPAASSGAASTALPPPAPAAPAGQKQSFTLAEVQAQVASAITQLTQRFYTRDEVEDRIAMKVPPEISSMRNVPDGSVPRKHVGYLQINSLGGQQSTAYWGDGPEGGEGVDWSKIMFGYKVNPDGDNPLEVRIYAGRIASIVVAQADVVLPGADGDYYVYVRRAKSNDSTSVMSGADWPDDDATYAYYILHQFEVEAGVAGIKTVIRPLARDKMQVDKTGLQYQVLQIDAEGAVTVDWLRAGP